jgi:hypothetical protein
VSRMRLVRQRGRWGLTGAKKQCLMLNAYQ